MFTSRDLDRVIPELKGLKRRSIFSPSKNLPAYRLSKMNSQYRGRAIEKMVRNGLLKKHTTDYHGGSHSHDITLNSKVRVEVKSALAVPTGVNSKGKPSYKFSFKHVQLKKFDVLFLVYVMPNGLQLRWMSAATAREFVSNTKRKSSQIEIRTNNSGLQGTSIKKLKMVIKQKKKVVRC